ncbi:ribonuclease P protein subunit p40-like isoform X2 [Pseudomyrmex gracilis]|uniref:ribonuclease P protein subunit p40-like isoform X2 n=1 Tax=Pseudomyrmex gracilis TaxID=219809 RepID=UPI000995C52C|nr:ribonuclease P protein subunit p40-like isoform X2 [Pseudomyrmex gracilis]
MLCPETWNFKPAQHCFSIDRRDIEKDVIPEVIKTHYFNHSISVVLPDTVIVPDSLRNCLSEDTEYYRINALRVCDLLKREFIEAFVKNGEVSILTIDNKIDLQNSICVTPSGHLVLSLLTEDYQALGLEGKPSCFDYKPHTRYMRIDLTNETFVPGKKNYERVRVALEERLKQNFDVILSWDPPDTKICPSSIAAWFYTHNYSVCLCHQKFSQKIEYSLTIPVLQEESNIDRFFEWLGVFSVGDIQFNEETDDYVTTYKCPSPSMYIGQMQHLKYTGFFTRKKVEEIYYALKEYALSRNALPWVSLDVQGFADSPVSWNLKEHTFFTDGDNSYTVVFRPRECIIRKSLSSNNRPKP